MIPRSTIGRMCLQLPSWRGQYEGRRTFAPPGEHDAHPIGPRHLQCFGKSRQSATCMSVRGNATVCISDMSIISNIASVRMRTGPTHSSLID